MFATSRPFLPFDYLRVPYVLDTDDAGPDQEPAPERFRRVVAISDGRAASLTWPDAHVTARAAGQVSGIRRFRLGSCVLHARVLDEELLAPVLTGSERTWRRGEPLLDGEQRVGSVWWADDGSIVLPFDPSEVVTVFWSEAYTTATGSTRVGQARSAAVRAYYAVRPLLPRRVQLGLRRAYSHVQERTPFPRWPVETSLHDFHDLLLRWAASVSGSAVPWIAPWPHGRTWALVLTHDVETADGMQRIGQLRDIELETGHRSSWNFVPGRYRVADSLVAGLKRDGFEVGVHGFRHDGRDLDPEHLPRRLPEMLRHAERWGATGFRSPATHRSWATMATLPFDYDSSYPDTDPFEPQPGGCCSWFPFAIGPVVELPITLPQDHTLFVILRARDGQVWLDKTERIRQRGGMALLLTHPDYVEAGPARDAYRQLLTQIADDPDVWHALPTEVAGWWRRRAGSHLERDGGSWRVRGPAAGEASIRFAHPPTPSTWVLPRQDRIHPPRKEQTVSDVTIVGAGPYGLAAAATLRRAGVRFSAFGEAMSFWEQHMPKGMLLRSPYVASSIGDPRSPLGLDSYVAGTGREVGTPVPLERFVEYGHWVASEVVPDLDTRRVVQVEHDGSEFRLLLDDGERVGTRRLVVAAGIGPFPRVPAVFQGLPTDLVSHASEHRDLSRFAGRRVLVVGAGQSALESAALLHEAGAEVAVVARGPAVRWLRRHPWLRSLGPVSSVLYAPAEVGPPLLCRLVEAPHVLRLAPDRRRHQLDRRSIRPAGAGWLRPRVEGLVPIELGREVVAAEAADGGVAVSVSDGTRREYDHVLLGTGYRVHLSRYPFLPSELLARVRQVDGYPVLGRGFESSVPGLHFLGAPAAHSYGPLMRFVAGTPFTAAELARTVAPSARATRAVRARTS